MAKIGRWGLYWIHQSRAKSERSRAAWFSQFQAEVEQRRPDLAGKILWEEASFYYNSEFQPADAAARYVTVPR